MSGRLGKVARVHQSRSSPQRQEAAGGQHAGLRLPARSRKQGGSRGPAAQPRISHFPEDARFGPGQDGGLSEAGAGNAPAPEPEDDTRGVRQAMTKDKLEAQGMFLELLFRGRKDLEKAAPVTVVVQ